LAMLAERHLGCCLSTIPIKERTKYHDREST
jgi:hypothetical protein